MAATQRVTACIFVGLFCLVFLAPFDHGAGGDLIPLTGVALAAIWLAAVLARTPFPTPHAPAVLPLAALLLLATLSVAWSIDPFVSLTGVVRILACTVAFLGVLRTCRPPSAVRQFCWLLVGWAAVLALGGVWQSVRGTGQFTDGPLARAHSVFVTPNTFAGFLIVALPAGIALVMTSRGALRRAAGLLTAAIFAGLVLSQSRGAWVAGAVGLLLLLWQLARQGRVRRPHRAMAGLALAATVAAAAVLVLSPGLRERTLSSATLAERLLYWQAAGRMAVDSFPLGTGLDSYHLAYPAYQPAALAGTTQCYAHNDYLQLAAELGPVGLVLLLWLLWRVAGAARRVQGQDTAPPETPLLAACVAGAAAGLLHSAVDFNLYVPATALSIFLCLGVVAAAGCGLSGVSGESRPERRRVLPRLLISAGATLAALAALAPLAAQRLLMADPSNAPLATTVCPLSADLWARLSAFRAPTDRAGAVRACRRAIALSPRRAAHHARLGQLLSLTAPDRAKASFERAIGLSPYDANLYGQLGLFLLKNDRPRAHPADSRRGLGHLRRECELAPRSAVWRFWLGRACLTLGHVAEGRRHLRTCIERCSPGPALRRDAEQLLRSAEGDAVNLDGRADGHPSTKPSQLDLDRTGGLGDGNTDPGGDRGTGVHRSESAAASACLARVGASH